MRVNDDYSQCNAEQQLSDPTSVFAYWSRLLKVRKQNCSTFVYGRFQLLEREHAFVLCYRRFSKAGVATIAMNFSDNDQEWSMSPDIAASWKNGVRVLGNYEELKQPYGQTMPLRPFEAIVMFELGDREHL